VPYTGGVDQKRRIGTGRLYARTAFGSGALAFGLVALTSSPVYSNPQGGVVSAGTAAISGQGTQVVQVSQQTGRAVIDWQSFNIGAGETTRFNQPSSSSAILNRIHDQDPSQIMGNLSANGIVALVNPNGMVFGQGSQIADRYHGGHSQRAVSERAESSVRPAGR